MRSISAITPRSPLARGGASTPSAASVARAKAMECATVESPDSLAAKRAAARGDLLRISDSVPLCV